ncbi:ABC transporter ATP-binding protein [Rhizobium sp. TRM95796]|uniref:ABC transporter ATP-binding protein n=1 Tax=Rhizobium sp. TRM95796 TaxID=2979862 RepID=UPI0021E7C1F8|nr:ABC transporter ATP-binding protein [Rhizobium sp. TRM95796]MCV3768873.1 ABC transporter ATP-binding protein [Rhizobium sp. TRM95796]
MSQALLDVKNLNVRFGPVHAVRDVSFQVAAGETLGVVGESGSGKSTTMLAMLGLHPKRQADVTASQLDFDGEDLLSKPGVAMRDLRGRRVGLIFQDPLAALNPLMTVGKQIAEVLIRHRGFDKKTALAEAVNLLERTGVPDPNRRAGQFPHQFSGGMRQRVMIAIALAGRPDLLIADEPTTALDVTVQAEIVRLIRDIQQASGMGLVWITHDLALMARVADRVMVMYAGAVVEEAPVDRLYAAPRHPYTAGLLGSIARLDQPRGKRASAIAGAPPSMSQPVVGCAFAPRCPLRFDKCSVAPPLMALGEGASAACWRVSGEQS